MTAARSHYDVLGVTPRASRGEVRAAYRRRMRALHPDAGAQAGGSASSSAEIAAVTEAWHVLGDARRRAAYDAGTPAAAEAPAGGAGGPAARPAPRPRGPARFPWRAVTTIAAVGAVAVLALHALGVTTPPPGPDSLITAGSCVDIDELGAAYEVDCAGPHEAVVRVLVGFDMTCPSDTLAVRDRQGMGTACIEPSSEQ
ncbi:MAG: J domain-containing protein [Ilumatobacteraceae bacterium]